MKRKAFKKALGDICKTSCFMRHVDDSIYPECSSFKITTGKHMRFLWKTVMEINVVKWDYCRNPKFVDDRKYHLWMDEREDGIHVGVCLFALGKSDKKWRR